METTLAQKQARRGIPWKTIILPVFAGLVLREVFAPFTGHPFDFELWVRLGYYVSRGHDPYTVLAPVPNLSFPGAGLMTSIGYPPLWPFLQAGLYLFYTSLGTNDRFLYYFIIKQPMILADLLAGYLIYKIVETQTTGQSHARSALLFWLFCPYTIVISAIWGMFDQIILDLVLVTIFWITQTAKSALAEALGILLKAIPVIFLPIFALAQKSRGRMIIFLAVSFAVSISLTIAPYLVFKNWNILGLEGTGSDIASKVGNSINYWVVVFVINNYGLFPKDYFPILRDLSYLWIPAVVIGSIFCAKALWKKGISHRDLLLSVLFVLLIFFLVRPQINEQYVIYFLGLGLIDLHSRNHDRKRTFHWVWLSAFVFLVANNVYFIRFLQPLSTYYSQVAVQLTTGPLYDVRNAIMIIAGLSFTLSSIIYLRLLYAEIKKTKQAETKVAPLSI